MKERAVVDWRVSASIPWTGFIVGLLMVVIAICFFASDLLVLALVCAFGGAMIIGSIVHLIVRASYSKRLAALKHSGSKIEAIIIGTKNVRKFDVDLSPLSLLDGSSGISFPKVVAFEARDNQGSIYVSRPTNVPVEIAERYLGLPVAVFVEAASGNCYVDVEKLPSFDPMEAIRNILGRK